jgi:hypothetical protein
MKKSLPVILSTALIASLFSSVAFAAEKTTAQKFADLQAQGIFSGINAAGDAGLNLKMTRAEFAVIIAKVFNLTQTTGSSFSDAKDLTTHWAAGYIGAVEQAGLMAGVGNGLFGAKSTVTAQELATVLDKAFKIAPTSGATVTGASDWAKGYVEAALANKLIPAAADYTTPALRGALVDAAYGAVQMIADANLPTGVASVVATNDKQITINFNTAADSATVTDVTKYKIAGQALTADATATGATAALSADGKSVVITLAGKLTSTTFGAAEGNYVNFQYADLKDAKGAAIKGASVPVLYSDKVAPTLVSASAKASTVTRAVTFTFSEPVDFTAASVNLNGTYLLPAPGPDVNSITVTAGSDLTAGNTYNFSVLNIKDIAGNLVSPNPVTGQVTVTKDTVAPNVTNVAVVRDNLLEVTFDKAMDATTLNGTNVKVTDPNGNGYLLGGLIVPKANTGNTVFQIPLANVQWSSAGTFTGQVSFTAYVKDTSGNTLTAVTKAFSLVKDTVAPAVVSTSYKNVTSYNTIPTPNGAVVVKFNKPVVLGTATPVNYSVVDDQGSVAQSVYAANINTNDATELVLTLKSPIASTGIKSYLILVPGSAVKDQSLSGNSNAAVNVLADITAGAPAATADTTAPTLGAVTVTAATYAVPGTTINVAVYDNAGGSGLDLTTVVNPLNYRLNGAPLPANSYVTYDGVAGSAAVHIPAGSIAADTTTAVLNIDNIKDKAGNTTYSVNNKLALNGDTAPVLTSAVLNGNGTLTLSFSEGVIPVIAGNVDATNFVLTVNGVAYTNFTLADGVGADAGKYVLIPAAATDLSGAITVTIATQAKSAAATGATVTDTNTLHNALKTGTSITVK